MYSTDQLDVIADICLKKINKIKISYKVDDLTPEEKKIAKAEVSALRAIITKASPPVEKHATSTAEKRILLVDDAESIRMILKGVLTSCGYSLINTAKNGKDAIAKIENSYFSFDLILCDWEMPLMSGLDFLKYIRKVPKNKTTPFIMITARNSKNDFKMAMEMGATAYIVKPINQKLVERKIKSILGDK